MKTFDEYKPDDLLALTPAEVDQLVDLECAIRGVALMPKSPESPTEVAASPDVVIYNAGGMKFRDEVDAQKVCDLLNSLPTVETFYLSGGYSYSGPQGVKTGDKERTEAPTKSSYWSEAFFDQHRTAIASYKEAKMAYDKDRKEYERILSDRTVVAEEIAAVRRKAQADIEEIALVKFEFNRYLVLADQNRDVALKFYLDATNFEEDFIREILGFAAQLKEVDIPTEG